MIKKHIPAVFCLSALILAALIFRIYSLDYKSLSVDEAALWLISSRPLNQILPFMRECHEVHPPLYFFLTHPISISYCSEFVLRIFSVLFSIIALVFIYKTVMILTENKTAANTAGLFFVASSFERISAQEFRMYSLLALFFILSFFLTISYLKQNNKLYPVILTIINTAGLYLHYLYVFSLIIQIIILLRSASGSKKNLLITTLLPAIFFLPWILYFFNCCHLQDFSLRASPTLLDLPKTLSALLCGPCHSHLTEPICMILSAVTIIWVIMKSPEELKIAFLIPFTGIFLLSTTGINIFEIKYFIILSPFICCSLGVAGDFILTHNAAKKAAVVCLIIIISANILSTYNYIFSPAWEGQNWRKICKEADQRSSKNDIIVVHPSMMAAPVYYYYNGKAFIRPADTITPELIREISEFQNLWVISTPLHPFAMRKKLTEDMNSLFIKKKEYETGRESYSAIDYITLIKYEI